MEDKLIKSPILAGIELEFIECFENKTSFQKDRDAWMIARLAMEVSKLEEVIQKKVERLNN